MNGIVLDQNCDDVAVFGFDYRGFSRWVQDQIERDGAAAAERITVQINAAMAHIAAGLEGRGWQIVETLGDGALAIASPGEEDAALFDVIVREAGIALPFRRAFARGAVTPLSIAGLSLWTGAGIEACHAAMRSDHAAEAGTRLSPQKRMSRSLIDAEIVRETVGFVCLRGLTGDAVALDRTARIVAALTEAHSGLFEKATQDDKGTMLRCHFGLPHHAIEWGREVSKTLARDQVNAGIGLAEGLLYRSVAATFENAPVVHGVAVNRAAKLAGTAQGLALSNDLPDRAARPRVPSVPKVSVGRDAELAQITSWLSAGPVAIDIVADPGLGKTHLLDTIVVASRARIARATGQARTLYEPFALLREWLAALGNDDRHDLVTPRQTRNEAELIAWGDAIVASLAAAQAKEPILFIADDLQWADATSIDRLDALRAIGAKLLYARRPGSRAPGADRTLQLQPLDDRATAMLLGAAASTDEGLLRLSGGNPFHALQLARAIGDAIDLSDVTVSGDAGAVVDARLRALDRLDRAVLRLASVLQRPATPAIIKRLAERAGAGLPHDRFDQLVERQFLRRDNDRQGYAIVHALMAERVVATMPPSLVPRLHHDVARVLADERSNGLDVSPDEIALHWEQAEAPQRAALLFGKAGLHALESGAHDAALALLSRAKMLAEAGAGGAERRALWSASASLAAWGQGQVRLAASLARDAHSALNVRPSLRTPTQRQRRAMARLRAHVAYAEAAQFRGEPWSILRGNFGAIRWGHVDDGRSAARARGLTFVGATLGVLRMRAFSRLIFRGAARWTGDPRSLAYLQAGEAVVELGFGRWAKGRALLDDAARNLAHDPEPQLDEVVLTLRALMAQMTGDLAASEAQFNQLAQRGRERGNALMDAWGRYGAGEVMLARGAIDDAYAAIMTARKLLGGLGDMQSELICAGLLAQIAGLAGDDREAILSSRAALTLARQVKPTNFASIEGFSGPAIGMAVVVSRGGVHSEDARLVLKQAQKVMRGYTRVFPIGKPRLQFVDALGAGDERSMAAARRLALTFGMNGDADAMDKGGLWRRSQ